MERQMQGAYSFSSEPRAIKQKRPYRESADDIGVALNMMADPRIIRGNTYSLHLAEKLAGTVNTLGTATTKSSIKDRTRLRKKKKQLFATKFDLNSHADTHEPIDLSRHLEEQVEEAPLYDVSTQTDKFVNDDEETGYVPRKTGIDASTQIYSEDNLYNFDVEVTPLLSVLVSKTVDQALMEVEQEEELKAIQDDVTRFLEEKEKEAEQVKEQEIEAIREAHKKRKAVEKAQKTAARRELLLRKIRTAQIAGDLWDSIRDETWTTFERDGIWRDPVLVSVEQSFMPWVMDHVGAHLQQARTARETVTSLIGGAHTLQLQDQAAFAVEKAKVQAQEAKDRARKNRRGQVRVVINAGSLGLEEDEAVGPLEVHGLDTVQDVEDRVLAWLAAQEIDFIPPDGGFLRFVVNGEQLDGGAVLLDRVKLEEGANIEATMQQQGGAGGSGGSGGGGNSVDGDDED